MLNNTIHGVSGKLHNHIFPSLDFFYLSGKNIQKLSGELLDISTYGGLVQVLSRYCTPPPHVWLHGL